MQSAASEQSSVSEDQEGQLVAGDQELTEELRIEDLDRVTTREGDNMPDEGAGADPASPKVSSPMKKRLTMSSAAGKTNGSPTPIVKKVLNSGTFGAGSVKPAGSKITVTPPATTKPMAPVLKKSTTSPPSATASKPTVVTISSSKPTPAALARRVSVVPAKPAPGLSKQSLSASASSKPSEELAQRASPTGSVGLARSPAPTSGLGRPRASVTEAVKKPNPLSRPSMSNTTKLAAPTKATTLSRSSAAVSSSSKPSRVTGLNSSLQEVKEETRANEKAISELKVQLEDAKKSLDSKTTAISDLEDKIANLEESLTLANAERDTRVTTALESDQARVAAESLHAAAQDALIKVGEELMGVKVSLGSAEKELEAAKLNALAQDEVVESLGSQVKDLEATGASSRQKMCEMEESHAKATADMTKASSIEREALFKAQADVQSHSQELEAHKVAHADLTRELDTRTADLKAKAEEVVLLKASLDNIKAEKDENATRISELEVEILEVKEAQDGLEDARDSLQKRVNELEQRLVNAATAAEGVADATRKKEADHTEKLAEITSKHEKELQASGELVTEVFSALEKLKTEYAEVLGGLEQKKQEIVNQEQQHSSNLEEVKKAHADALAVLSSQLEQVSRDLNEQESIYNSKVDAVKTEHSRLLEDAFERAKNEAAHAHAQELHALRSDSNSTIEQIQEAHRVALEESAVEHASVLGSEVNSLNTQINKLNVELKATRDDLAKAKSSLGVLRGEIESLTKQRDEARAQAEVVPAVSPEQTEEISRLMKELLTVKDDLAAMTDMFNLTKSSMEELSDKQAKGLEAAAKSRAEEVLQLRAVHDTEVNQLASQKSELLVRLSDLEGELATAKAALAAQEASSPRVNGNGVSSPPGVTKEELQKLHEAHNLKIHDLQAEHDKTLKSAKEELDEAMNQINELQQDVARKAMEVQYMQTEQDENQEEITKLRADMEALSATSQ